MKITFILNIKIIIFLLLASNTTAQVIYDRSQPSLYTLMNQKNHERKQKRKKIGLVLSGGSSRGLTHVGIFKGFEKNNIPIDLIVGTSMGSVVGGFYAAGYSPDRMEKIMKDINWDDFFSDNTERKNLFLGQKEENDRYLMKIRFDGYNAYIPPSLTSGQKMLSFLSDKLLHANFQAGYNFDNLKVPFRAVSTDLVSGKRIVIGKGDLAEAINASTAVPLLFAPVEWEGMLLVDGGLRSNFAVDVAKSLGMEIIIAVDVTSPLRKPDKLKAPWEIADQATMIMMQNTYEKQLKSADIVLKPNLKEIEGTDFTQIDFMINEGEKIVDSLAYQIKRIIEKHKSENSNPHYNLKEFNLFIEDKKEMNLKSFNLNAINSNTLSLQSIKNDIDSLFSLGIFSNVNAELQTMNSDTLLNYFLSKNVQIKEIDINGNNLVLDSILLEYLSQNIDKTLNFNTLSSDLNKLRQFYWKTGYSLMRYKSIDFDRDTGLLYVDIDEGVIDKIDVQGNKKTEKFVVLREFPLSENNIFISRLVKQGLENVYNTQLFERVNLNLETDNEQKKLVIKVKEKKYTALRIGGKVGLERGAQSYLELADENFLGMGNKISVLGRFGDYDRKISLNFRVDRIFESYLTFEMHGYYNWQINPEYNNQNSRIGEYLEERRGSKLILGQQLKKLGQVTVEFRLENVKDKKYSGQFSNKQNSELRTIAIRSITDKRDKIAFTNSGIYNVWYWESGNESILEGQAKYTKAFVNLEGFYSVLPGHTFHVKSILGVADKTLPFSEWFRIGGFHSFMGLHDYEYYGRQVIDVNLEYRYKFPFDFFADTYIGLRYDLGAVWKIPNLVIYDEDFFHGFGGWLGVDTIFGPLYIGYGDASSRRGVFYLSLGYNF